MLSLFESYLNGRIQRVSLNGFSSDYAKIESGVPQGSVLGPLLFLIYINDLEKNIKSNVKFFADDTMLFSVVKDPTLSANDLTHDLKVISRWAFQWKMEFNPDPSKQATEMLFSCKKSEVEHPQLSFNDIPVTRVKEHKHLGLIFEPNLTFGKHLHDKMMIAKKNIGIIKHLNKFLPLKTLTLMYKALVRSHLEYCDIIYHIPHVLNTPYVGISLHSLMEKVESIQYQSALAVTGSWKGSSRAKLYDELGWESLSDRRMSRRVLQIHKIVAHNTPTYLRQKLPPGRRNLIFLPYIFQNIRCRTGRYKNSFFPDSISIWNEIICDFEHFPTFSELKNHLLSLIRPIPRPTFDVYDPTNLRYIFQLRIGLSHLRSHKFRHNFVDTQSDKCLCHQGVEDTCHFLLFCPFYETCRATLITGVQSILQKNDVNCDVDLKVLLYGHPSLDDKDNRNIITLTISYIINTKRFSPNLPG